MSDNIDFNSYRSRCFSAMFSVNDFDSELVRGYFHAFTSEYPNMATLRSHVIRRWFRSNIIVFSVSSQSSSVIERFTRIIGNGLKTRVKF